MIPIRECLLLICIMATGNFSFILGERNCPALAAQSESAASLDLSSFSAYLDISGGYLSSGSGSGSGDLVKLISGGVISTIYESVSPTPTLSTNQSNLNFRLTLTDSYPTLLYYLLNVWSIDSGIAPPGCPRNQGQLIPGTDSLVEVQLSCEGDEDAILQICLTIGTAPFNSLEGAYKTLEFYIHRKCSGPIIANDCGVRDQDSVVAGQICITPNQSRELVSNPIGSWEVLLSALGTSPQDNRRGYCVIDEQVNDTSMPGLAVFADKPSLRPMFAIAEEFLDLDMYVAPVTGAQAMAFSMIYLTTNYSVLSKPYVEPLTRGVVHEDTPIYLYMPCVAPGLVEVPSLINMSTVLMDTLYSYSYNFSIYRNCTPANSSMSETPSHKPIDTLKIQLVAGLVPVVVILITAITVSFVAILLTRRIKKREVMTLKRMKSMENLSSNNAYRMTTVGTPFDLLGDLNLEYNFTSLQVECELGEGAFGKVFKARAPGLERDGFVPEFVAVKTLKDDTMSEEFCKEVKAVAKLNHPNIVQLVGVCSSVASQKCMIFEFMDQGSLDNLLRQSDPDNQAFNEQRKNEESVTITPSMFLDFSVKVAHGLAYLAEQKYVHRDIAARNCLVNSKLEVKIGDFGLSRELSSADYYRVGGTQASLPVRWMPPEALLFGKFTTQSDVWSFGILMWEIYTFGHQPYTGLSNHEVIDCIKNSKILECPKMCPAVIFHTMKMCWTRSPVKRPNMDVVVAQLERLLTPGEYRGQGGVADTKKGGTVYVNLEYGAQVVEQDELEESMRVERENIEEPLPKLSTNDDDIISNVHTLSNEEENQCETKTKHTTQINTDLDDR